MRTLVEDRRIEFYRSVLDLARQFEVSTCVAVADTNYRTARDKSLDHQDDVTALFLERVSYALGQSDGLIVIAKPGGGAKDDEKFLARCFDLIDTGTEYESLRNLPLGVFTAHSRRIRLLQLADLIASCTLARVSGESRYSPEIFELILPLFRRGVDRIGGIGVKIHPDLVYANLYYWLFGISISLVTIIAAISPIRISLSLIIRMNRSRQLRSGANAMVRVRDQRYN